jgi:hydrogenase maturation factor
VVQSDEYTHQVDLSLVKDVKVGDFLIVKGDLAINKVEKQEAEKIINLVSALNK